VIDMLFSISRERKARIYDGLAVTLLMVFCAVLGMILLILSSPAAKAEPSSGAVAYAAEYGGAVCSVLSEHPSTDGMVGIMAAIQQQGLAAYQAGEVMGLSVAELCPQYTYLLREFVTKYRGSDLGFDPAVNHA